jgi:hypothetical protein
MGDLHLCQRRPRPRLNLCQNRLDPAFGIHVVGGLLVIACYAVALGESGRQRWATVSTIAIAPFLFLTVVANDMARWALFACFNVWLFAAARGRATFPLQERARLLPLAASLALRRPPGSRFRSRRHPDPQAEPLLEHAAQRFLHKYTMRFPDALERCDPTWRDLLTHGTR